MKQRRINDKNRITIPFIMLEGIEAKAGDLINIEYSDKQIIITNPKIENKRIKTKREIEQKLHNLKELIKEGIDDEKLFGSVETLEWVLKTERDIGERFNDYDDAE